MRKLGMTFLAAAFLVSACKGIPVPPEKSDYVGHWQQAGVTLVITADGGVSYSKVSGSGNTKINAPIQKFVGNDFEVGAMGITTVFKVQEPPHQDPASGGAWKMTVDGVTLTRVP